MIARWQELVAGASAAIGAGLGLIIGLVFVACSSTSTKPVGPVAPPVDSSTAAIACFNLRAAGCPEGDPAPAPGDTCETTMTRNDPRLAIDARCVADAGPNVAALRKCPLITCKGR